MRMADRLLHAMAIVARQASKYCQAINTMEVVMEVRYTSAMDDGHGQGNATRANKEK